MQGKDSSPPRRDTIRKDVLHPYGTHRALSQELRPRGYHLPEDLPRTSSHRDAGLLRDTQPGGYIQPRPPQQERRDLSTLGEYGRVYKHRPTAEGKRTKARRSLHQRSQRDKPRRLAATPPQNHGESINRLQPLRRISLDL